MTLPEPLCGRVFTRATALAAGVSDRRLGLLRSSGVVRHLWNGVWCDAACAPTEVVLLDGLALVAPSVVASHATAARQHGADPADPRLHVTVPAAAPLRSGVGLVVHRDSLSRREVVVREGRALTDPYRTAIDVARAARPGREAGAVEVVDALLWVEALEHEELRSRLARTPTGRGIALARRVVGLARYGAASPGETRLRLVLGTGGVPEPVLQHRIRCGTGDVVVVDFCWPARRLVVEYDGFAPHTGRRTFERDRRRWSWLRGDGWDLRAYTAESVRHRPVEIAREVRALLVA